MTGTENPLWEEWRAVDGDPGPDGSVRRRLHRSFGFGIPDDAVLDAVVDAAPPAGVVEIGAGSGYWARLLAARGVDVVAYDLHPPPSPENKNFGGVEPWHPVLQGDETAVARHPDRLLLLVWPTADEDWPAEALSRFHAAGGRQVAYVGGSHGGPTGDDRFHRLLGSLEHCLACDLGVANAACVCSVRPQWHLVTALPAPRWRGDDDELRIYGRDARERVRRRRWRHR